MFEKEELSCEFIMESIWGGTFLTLPGSRVHITCLVPVGIRFLWPQPKAALPLGWSSWHKTACGPSLLSH